jgi:molybdate-binding protein/transcriptional regulator with XRE-family HTH domain
MSNTQLTHCVRQRRLDRGWSQQELADRAGLPRATVSAIETARITPSTAAALALASALGCRVEDLFRLATAPAPAPAWAWPPPGAGRQRFWIAESAGRRLLYPAEATHGRSFPHDGMADGDALEFRTDAPPPTLVLASCDPAVELLVAEVARTSGVRVITYFRSSRAALELLKQGLVHAAGLHLDGPGGAGNVAAARTALGEGYRLVRAAEWEEGVVVAAAPRAKTLRGVIRAKPKWVGREPGSGARQCLDHLVGAVRPHRTARDHHGVVEAVRGGWADAGVCPRLVAEESGLPFFSVRQEAFDLCFAERFADDPRMAALLAALRSPAYRRQLADLPGYNVQSVGESAGV